MLAAGMVCWTGRAEGKAVGAGATHEDPFIFERRHDANESCKLQAAGGQSLSLQPGGQFAEAA